MKNLKKTMVVMAALLVSTVVFECASAANYPTRPVELLIPMGAGGSHDINARAVTAVVPKYLGQPMPVTLRPGASGVIGTTEVANAPKDGYKLILGGTGPNSSVPLAQEVPYNEDSFIPIAMINYSPVLVCVPGSSPYKSVKELVDAINAKPGELNYASSGLYSNQHVPIAMLWHAAGVMGKITPIQFDGGGPQVAALLGGHADVGTVFASQVIDQLKTGALRALAITDSQRATAEEAEGILANVPTLKELGYDVVFRMWRAVLAPAGIPKDVEMYLRDVFAKLSKDKEYHELLFKIGERSDLYLDGPDFKKFWDAERASFLPVIQAIKELEG